MTERLWRRMCRSVTNESNDYLQYFFPPFETDADTRTPLSRVALSSWHSNGRSVGRSV
ncbi:unnamed protein product, partial [Ceratitis capitata]